MPVEHRTRVTILLPVPQNPSQFLLFDAILTDLITLCGGVTSSSMFPEPHHDSVFHGWWIDELGQTIQDSSILLIADAPFDPIDLDLQTYLQTLKLSCQQNFEQDIVWITINAIDRISNDDFVR